MGKTAIIVTAVLVSAAIPAWADAPLVHCLGTESGGSGPRQYAYAVDCASYPTTDFRVGTNDLDGDHYTAVLVPAGWSFAVEEAPMMHAHGVKTPHGQVSPGPCYCLTAGSVHWWTEDPLLAVEAFTFGYNHPWCSEDVGWELTSRPGGPTSPAYVFQADWDAPAGTGYGPLHGPYALLGYPTLEYEVVWGTCLEGVYGYVFSVRGNDGHKRSFFADVTWRGIDAATVLSDQCELFEPWASNVTEEERGNNLYHIAAGTGLGGQYEELGLAYIVVEGWSLLLGVLEYEGTISRSGVDYPVHGIAPLPRCGDANLDGSVDGADYTLWADHYNRPAGWQQGDFNGDHMATGADYTLWADSYLGGCAGTPVPEPACAVLLALGALAPIRRKYLCP